MRQTESFPLDDVAIRLAADAGQAWTAMNDFPGYTRTIWRDEARLEVLRRQPAAQIECLPTGWDGREGMCFVKTVRPVR